jgi:hypothetical protein
LMLRAKSDSPAAIIAAATLSPWRAGRLSPSSSMVESAGCEGRRRIAQSLSNGPTPSRHPLIVAAQHQPERSLPGCRSPQGPRPRLQPKGPLARAVESMLRCSARGEGPGVRARHQSPHRSVKPRWPRARDGSVQGPFYDWREDGPGARGHSLQPRCAKGSGGRSRSCLRICAQPGLLSTRRSSISRTTSHSASSTLK